MANFTVGGVSDHMSEGRAEKTLESIDSPLRRFLARVSDHATEDVIAETRLVLLQRLRAGETVRHPIRFALRVAWNKLRQVERAVSRVRTWDEGAPKIRLDLAPFQRAVDPEVGDVVLDVGPLLVAGRVVDEDGNPLEDASVSVMASRGNGAWSGLGSYIHEKGIGNEFRLHWQRGRPFPTEELRLRAGHKFGLNTRDMTKFTIGSRGHTLVVTLGGGIAGSIESSGELPLRVIAFSTSHRRIRVSTAVRADGSFRFGRLRAGLITVLIQSRASDPQSDECLARVDGVRVREVNRDPRLQGIVLATGTRAIAITAEDWRGRPVRDVHVFAARLPNCLAPPEATGRWRWLPALNPWISLLRPRAIARRCSRPCRWIRRSSSRWGIKYAFGRRTSPPWATLRVA